MKNSSMNEHIGQRRPCAMKQFRQVGGQGKVFVSFSENDTVAKACKKLFDNGGNIYSQVDNDIDPYQHRNFTARVQHFELDIVPKRIHISIFHKITIDGQK